MGSAWGIIRVKAHVLNYNSDDTYVQIMICHHPKEREQKKVLRLHGSPHIYSRVGVHQKVFSQLFSGGAEERVGNPFMSCSRCK